MLNGYKTYLAAAAMFLFGLYGAVTGSLDPETAMQFMLNAAGLFGLRKAIK